MKKLLFFLFILIALCGTAFFLGWSQLTVPPGAYGVMRSKTHGLDSQVIRDGEFRWLWYKLLPTNVKISVYNIGPVKRSFRNSGSLNSGQLYASLAGFEADFSWEVEGEFSFSLKGDALPEFTEKRGITDEEGLRQAEGYLAASIEQLVMDRLKTYTDNRDEKTLESLTITGSIPELNREIELAFPAIENFICSIRTVRYPDFDLYSSVKALYRAYLQTQNAVLMPDMTAKAEWHIDLRLRLDELSRYGELLTKYPILLEYLALEKSLND
jgi:hypothetical protein